MYCYTLFWFSQRRSQHKVYVLRMQSELKEVMHALSHLSSSLPGESTCLALTAPASPCRHGRQEHKSHHMELGRLRTEVALLRVRRPTCLDIHPVQIAKRITSFALR